MYEALQLTASPYIRKGSQPIKNTPGNFYVFHHNQKTHWISNSAFSRTLFGCTKSNWDSKTKTPEYEG
jgi:hypothetical protein